MEGKKRKNREEWPPKKSKNWIENPDIAVRVEGRYIVIELKVAFNLKQQMLALGQVLLAATNKWEKAHKVICIPDDIQINERYSELINAYCVTVCNERDLCTAISTWHEKGK